MKTTQIARQVARDLRKNPMAAEKELWRHLRDRKFLGYKFLRQHPIFILIDNRKRFLIADFYCHELLLVVEVDGEIHRRQKDYDEIRTHILKCKRVKVIRFTNDEVLGDVERVLLRLEKKIEAFC